LKKKIAIIGSTGSIGRQTIDVADFLHDEIEIYGLSAHTQTSMLAEQIRRYKPQKAVVTEPLQYSKTLSMVSGWDGQLLSGREGLLELVTDPEVDLVVSAVVGAAGIEPTLAALQAGKKVALANKESLVAAGEVIMEEASKSKGVILLPVDSEHSAIFQCLQGTKPKELKYIHLTASGGPFRQFSRDQMEEITPQAALAHPTWQMGGKITIDSATLMNKGLEVIEAHWLFGLDYDRIRVVIHPQSVVHSMIEMVDGSLLAQLGPADMRLPIQYALTYPKRKENPFSRLDLYKLSKLEFYPPDFKRFPCLALAYEAGKTGGTMPAVLNAANEEAVQAFLTKRIKFLDIPRLITRVMNEHLPRVIYRPDLGTILESDNWARSLTRQIMKV
jgi:1-deoxy-D-xylulose-5-phosphate reductoisomerase